MVRVLAVITALMMLGVLLPVSPGSAQAQTTTADPAWKGEYFINETLSGVPAYTKNDIELNFGPPFDYPPLSPDLTFPKYNFSVRWTRNLDFQQGTYRFWILADDGAKLFIDDMVTPKYDLWDQPIRWYSYDFIFPQAGQHNIKLEFHQKTGDAAIHLWWENRTITDWRGQYWNDDYSAAEYTGNSRPTILVRNDPQPNFDWGSGAPDPLVSAEVFSARWKKDNVSFTPGYYVFTITHTDGARLRIGNIQDQPQPIVWDNWCSGCQATERALVYIPQTNRTVILEMFHHTGDSKISFSWQTARTLYLPALSKN